MRVSGQRYEFEMTADDLKAIIDACSPVTYLVAGGAEPLSPQENANLAWKSLGSKMGFEAMTVEPVPHKGSRFFTAIAQGPCMTMTRDKADRLISNILTRGVDALPDNEADTIYGNLCDDPAFNASLLRYIGDETMTRMDLVLEIEARIEALVETMRRER